MFALPGIIVQNSLFTTLNTATGLSTDLEKGFFDRLRSLPIARFAPLSGRILADLAKQTWALAMLLAIGSILGFRVGTSPLGVLAAFGLVLVVHAGHLLGPGAGLHARGQPGEGADLRLRGAVPAHVHQRRVRPDRVDAGLAAGLVEGQPGLADLRRHARAAWCPARRPAGGRVAALRGGVHVVFAPLAVRAFKRRV